VESNAKEKEERATEEKEMKVVEIHDGHLHMDVCHHDTKKI
jgi:hypothetical protein